MKMKADHKYFMAAVDLCQAKIDVADAYAYLGGTASTSGESAYAKIQAAIRVLLRAAEEIHRLK